MADNPMQSLTLAPVQGESQRVKCRAHRRDGGPCGSWAVKGTVVCRMHGGSAPQVRDKARLRLAQLIEPAITVLAREMATAQFSADRIRAANSILDRAGYGRIATLDVEAARDVLTDRIITIMESDQTKP